MNAGAEQTKTTEEIAEEITKQSDNIHNLSEISKNSRTTFIAILLAVAYSYLTIGATTDAALFTNSSSSPLPIIQAQVPIVWFYYFAPIILFMLFIYFHVYLQRFWRCVAALPLWHEDGRTLDEYVYPWIVSAAFLRAEIPSLNNNNKFRLPLEAAISIILAWWLIPVILIFFWARFLTLHYWPGTIMHIVIIVLSVAGALRFYCAAKDAVNSKREPKKPTSLLMKPSVLSTWGAIIVLIVLSYISYGAIEGAPAEVCKQNDIPQCNWLHSGGRVLKTVVGYNPFADLNGNEFHKPENWWGLANDVKFKDRLQELPRPIFEEKDLRFADAKNAFLMRSNFQSAKLQWINLDNATLINADFSNALINKGSLDKADLRWSDLTDANLEEAHLWDADLHMSYLTRTNFHDADLSNSNLTQTSGVGVDFKNTNLRYSDLSQVQYSGASMIGTRMQKAVLTRANILGSEFECAKLNESTLIETALTDSIFNKTDFEKADLSNAKLDDAELTNVDFQGAIMHSTFAQNSKFSHVRFNLADMSDADFINAEFSHADFTDVSLDKADLAEATFQDSLFHDADFGTADLHGTVFKNSDLSGANLLYTDGLMKKNLQASCGDKRTQLPKGFTLPNCKSKKEVQVNVECVKE
jgi:uncharacterized protein YjbI with pentapeptide repeats